MITANLLAIALTASSIHAFTSSSINNNRICNVDIPLCAVDPTQALEDYMSKAHEEKLKAVKSVEDKKNEEIGALKAEIQQLKTSSSALATTTSTPPIPPAAPLANIKTAELEKKLASYQEFMADYIVKSQNEKLLAVKEAELKAEKKFQDRLEKLFAAGGMALSAGESAAVDSNAATVVVEESLFDKRNQQIIAAGAKSRWGSAEINRAIEQSKNAPTSTTAATSIQETVPEVSLYDLRNSQIIAAGAKSRWGSAEINRAIKNGATVAVAQPTVSAPSETAFDSRNSQVVASANAGQSRWGDKEVEKAKLSMEDRINLGASTLSSEVAATVFDSRNAQVVAAANAGKSRWGNMEVERAVKSGATAAVSAVKEEAKASIGLEDRINLGARLLSA